MTVWQAVLTKTSVALYGLALAWFWICAEDYGDWTSRLTTGLLLTLLMVLVACQELHATTSAAGRRAHLQLHRLAQRQNWPANLAEITQLPEVGALRDTLSEDPTPALMLLMHPRPEVRMAVLGALAFRPRWKRGQALLVMQVVKYAPEQPVRIIAIRALAHVTDPRLLGQLAGYLRDPDPAVRKATADALFADIRERWPAIRHSVRSALADPRCAADGALICRGVLPSLALVDLTVWAGEIGTVGKRSAITLIRYYRRIVQEDSSPKLIAHLAEQMLSSSVPAAVRVEMAHLVRDAGGLQPRAMLRMLDSDQPAPLRLLAAEAVLQNGEDAKAADVLREVARQPNRELAIAAAVVIQKCLRIDMGLPISQPPPPPQSKQGAEVTRRVMQWAMQKPSVAPPTEEKKSAPRIEDQAQAQAHVGLTDTPIPQPTPQQPFFYSASHEPASVDSANGAHNTKTPWIW
jgi:hypothetical protein